MIRFVILAMLFYFSSTYVKAENNIRIVGSSTVFPFISLVAEEFGKFSNYRTPIIESIGSGSGFKMFCSGIGSNTPDIAISSRKIKDVEKKLCADNKVVDIIEIIMGYDGIVIANSKNSQMFDFTKKDLFSVLSSYSFNQDNTAIANNIRLWSDVNSWFPDKEVEIYGPHENSGTYDTIVELIMLDSCIHRQDLFGNISSQERKKKCSSIRDDGRYIAVMVNENIIIQKIERNSNAFGILSFSFLIKNQDKIQGSKIAGIEPSYENIASGKYVLSRPLYLYVKKQHINHTLGLKEFILEVINEKTIGPNSYLINAGLIPLTTNDMHNMQSKVKKELN